MSKIEVNDRIVFEHGPYNLVRKQMGRTYLNIDRRIDIKNYSFFLFGRKFWDLKIKFLFLAKKYGITFFCGITQNYIFGGPYSY